MNDLQPSTTGENDKADETARIKLLVWRHAMGLIKAVFSVDEIIARLMKQAEEADKPIK